MLSLPRLEELIRIYSGDYDPGERAGKSERQWQQMRRRAAIPMDRLVTPEEIVILAKFAKEHYPDG